MKKSFLLAALCVAAVSASAQTTVKGDKFFDNWFVGINGGVYEPTVGQSVFGDVKPLVGLELGRWITPAFGLRANAHAGIDANNGNDKSDLFVYSGKTFFDFENLSVDALLNLNNFFGGYKGAPRPFEVVLSAGIGWEHFSGKSYWRKSLRDRRNNDDWAAKFGFDLNYNVTPALAITLKPSINYVGQFNVNRSYIAAQLGVTYKFKNSNGTHNFVLAQEGYSQADIDELNARINALRGDYEGRLNQANKTIADLKNELAAARANGGTVIKENGIKLAPVVIFDQAKSVINKSQQPSVQMIATYMKNHPNAKVTIKGYASPEGNKEFNQKLSERRAQAVYNMLTKTYRVDASRLKQVGLGPTSEIFPERDWNRVVVFVEE